MKFRISYFVFRILGFFATLGLLIFVCLLETRSISANTNYWSIQSIDTMKFSRDMARERSGDVVFERIIESVIEKIASTGATHVAIGTPYDEEFIPFLQIWVDAARKENLNVWFRGNFSGWEGWFDYPSMSIDDHKLKTGEFIIKNPNLFEDGDIFTSCTECENGSLGDPRQAGNLAEYRQFLIQEYGISKDAFGKIDKKVNAGYYSMNADVARLVMDEETTDKLGDVVVIDHYVKDPGKLAQDVKEISEKSGGKIVLGEFGVPIPDIHGPMSDQDQQVWLTEAFEYLSKSRELAGVNYWVSFGGSTAIWDNNGMEKPAVAVLRSYFLPEIIEGKILNDIGKPVENALIIADSIQTYSDKDGSFKIASNPNLEQIVISAAGYKEINLNVASDNDQVSITVEKEKESIFFKLQKLVYAITRKFKRS